MQAEYDGRQIVGIDLHRRRTVIVRMTEWNESDLTMEYLSPERSWHIEHIFADKHERHPDIPDPVEFRLLRNRIGVLGFLKATVNTSVKDMPLPEKIKVYRSENLLLRCLHSDYHLNTKPIRLFVERHGLKQHLRPLSSDGDLRTAVAVRGELYRRLCAAIWDREVLGFLPASVEAEADVADPVAPQVAQIPTPRAPAGRPTDIIRMLRTGLLTPGTSVVGHVGGADTTAHIEPDGQLRLATGDLFRKPDDAARAVVGKRCEGMLFWHVARPDGTRISLRHLRDEARTRATKAKRRPTTPRRLRSLARRNM